MEKWPITLFLYDHGPILSDSIPYDVNDGAEELMICVNLPRRRHKRMRKEGTRPFAIIIYITVKTMPV